MGIIIALIIIIVWISHLAYILTSVTVDFTSPVFYLHILVQAYLYTGLFITGHDAMHQTVSSNKKLNRSIGTIATFLYAGLSYKRLITNHFKHHRYPGTSDDPDFNVKSQNFFIWWGSFMFRYATIPQLLVMAIAFNVLKIWVPEVSLWFFWVIPAFLSSLQLFFFGTYLPHRKPHDHEMEPHKARTQKKNHLWAMISCYFFGYHFEHHDSPHTPWWQLYKTK
jgi:beta-carotene ketolase (CrtW type)